MKKVIWYRVEKMRHNTNDLAPNDLNCLPISQFCSDFLGIGSENNITLNLLHSELSSTLNNRKGEKKQK